jgi:hypothetical protein
MMDQCVVEGPLVPVWVQTDSSGEPRLSQSRILGEAMEAAEMEVLEQRQ